MKSKLLDPILVTVLLGTVISGFAYSWQRVNPGGPVMGMSADGRVICALPSFGPASISVDSGVTWKNATNNPTGGSMYPSEIAISANGGKIYAVMSSFGGMGIFRSSDLGYTWTRTSFPGTNSIFVNRPVACSADGSIVASASGFSPIYYSSDFGATCHTSSVPSAYWQSIASSANGQQMVAVASNENVYFSADFGATWSPTNLPVEPWTSACLSRDGQWVGVVSQTNSYISGNFGVTWLTNNIPGNNIACSADGTRWLIAGPQFCTSTNSGKTWLTNFASSSPLSFFNIGLMSADGDEVLVGVAGSGAWLGRENRAPHLDLRYQGSTVALSWLLPSRNFMLQQKNDFTNNTWPTIPITPSLILTNLQQQIILPATPGNSFFRLKAE